MLKNIARRLVGALSLLALVGVAAAADPVALPDIGFDPEAYTTAAVGKIGIVFGIIFGAAIALAVGMFVVRKLKGGSVTG